MMPDKKQIESTLEWFDSYVFPMLQANAEDVCNSNVIRTILQSALDTQKPAGDVAEALDWFNGILDVFHSKYEATEPDKEAEHISTIRAALTGDCGGGDVSELKALIKEVLDNAPGDDAEQFMLLPHALAEYGWFKRAKEALTADNAKRGDAK